MQGCKFPQYFRTRPAKNSRGYPLYLGPRASSAVPRFPHAFSPDARWTWSSFDFGDCALANWTADAGTGREGLCGQPRYGDLNSSEGEAFASLQGQTTAKVSDADSVQRRSFVEAQVQCGRTDAALMSSNTAECWLHRVHLPPKACPFCAWFFACAFYFYRERNREN